MYKSILKIILTVSLLFNSAGQPPALRADRPGGGYALRPLAFGNSNVKIEEVFKKPPVIEVSLDQIDIIESSDDKVREIQWFTNRGPFIEKYVSVKRFIRLGDYGYYLIKPYASGSEAEELFFQACVQGYANIMPCWLLTDKEAGYLKRGGVNIEEEKKHMLISASCNYHEGEASPHIIHTNPKKAYTWLLAANFAFAVFDYHEGNTETIKKRGEKILPWSGTIPINFDHDQSFVLFKKYQEKGIELSADTFLEMFLTNLGQGHPLSNWVGISEPFYVEVDEFIHAVNTFLNISLENAGERAIEMGAPKERIKELIIKARSWRKSVPDALKGLYEKLEQERLLTLETVKPILEGIQKLNITDANPFLKKERVVFAAVNAAA
jgi:hypothetical protein